MNENDVKEIEQAPKKKKRHFILVVLLMALVFILVGTLLGELLTVGIRALIPNRSDGVDFLFLYLDFIGIDLLVAAFCALWEKDIFRSFLSSPGHKGAGGNTLKHFALGLLIGFLMNGCCILIAWLHGDVRFYLGRFEPLYLLAALVCVCVQSGAEELVTRGYMLGALRQRYNVWVAIVANSLFFGALHLGNEGLTVLAMLEIIFIGFALSLVVYYLDSLWMAIAIHTSWNFTQNFLFGLPNSGIVSKSSFLHLDAAKDSLFYDVGFGVESTITAVIVSAALAVGVAFWAKKKKTGKEKTAA